MSDVWIGAILGVLGGVGVSWLGARFSHRAWVRGERLSAYAAFAADLDRAEEATLRLVTPVQHEQREPTREEAEQLVAILSGLVRPRVRVQLLGPSRVSDAADNFGRIASERYRDLAAPPDNHRTTSEAYERARGEFVKAAQAALKLGG